MTDRRTDGWTDGQTEGKLIVPFGFAGRGLIKNLTSFEVKIQ
jgi:hypothetical protein